MLKHSLRACFFTLAYDDSRTVVRTRIYGKYTNLRLAMLLFATTICSHQFWCAKNKEEGASFDEVEPVFPVVCVM